jgi:hypothetical protein
MLMIRGKSATILRHWCGRGRLRRKGPVHEGRLGNWGANSSERGMDRARGNV